MRVSKTELTKEELKVLRLARQYAKKWAAFVRGGGASHQLRRDMMLLDCHVIDACRELEKP